MIHQNPYESLNPTMMVFDIIANPIRRHQKIKRIDQLYKKVTELLETVGLTPVEDFVDKYPAFLKWFDDVSKSIDAIPLDSKHRITWGPFKPVY